MLRCMVTCLLENGRIETTVTRAKEVRAMAEKYITIGKDDSLAAKRQAMALHHQGVRWSKSCLTRSARHIKSGRAAIPALPKSGPAAATPPKWRSLS